ncbi:MAG: metallophosphoesterase [Verrucomicrobiales bacterium]
MNAEKSILIGLMADAQYADKDTAGTRYYRRSIEKLGAAVAWFNRALPDMVVHLGDLIDEGWENFDAPLAQLGKLSMPCHHVPGNHDFAVVEKHQPEVLARLGCGERWREMIHREWSLIFLDSNVLSTFAWPKGSDERKLAEAFLAELKAAGATQAKEYNGGLGPEQRAWLDKKLAQIAAAGRKCLIFCHQPVLPVGAHGLLDAELVFAILARHEGTVAAWFNGHNHQGAYERKNGIHFLTLHGMVETELANAHAMLAIEPGRLVIEGAGREPSRELLFG